MNEPTVLVTSRVVGRRRIRPWAVGLAASLLVSFGASTVLVAGAAQAAPRTPDTAVEALAICTATRYVVTGDGVAVRTAPSLSATILRRKYRGDIVVHPCVQNRYADGYEWMAVRLGTGGIGWMARIYLQKL